MPIKRIDIPDMADIKATSISAPPAWALLERQLIVQAGAFGEHRFTQVRHRKEGRAGEAVTPLDGTCFSVELPPSTAIRVEAGLKRFVNRPGYAFPWHEDTMPVPFQ